MPIDTAKRQRRDARGQLVTFEELVMLEYARRWEPFGGVTEGQVFTEFGCNLVEFYTRVDGILSRLLRSET